MPLPTKMSLPRFPSLGKKVWRLAFYAMMLLVLYGTLSPINDLSFSIAIDLPLKQYLDKIVHGFMFLLLTFLFCKGYPKTNQIWVGFWLALYGIMIEFMQAYMPTGRSFEILDWLADIVGIILGWMVYKLTPIKSKQALKISE